MKRATLILAALALMLGGVGRARGGNIVVNGGFESPTVSGTYYDLYTAGQSFTGWTVGQGTVAHGTDANNPSLSIAAYQGNQWLQLAGIGGSNGSIYQDLTTTPGATYTVAFAAVANPDTNFPPLVKDMSVYWGGSLVDSLTLDGTGHTFANPGWQVYTLTVTALSATTRLEFLNTTPGSNPAGPVIDAVDVAPASAVPEPSTLTLLGLGAICSLGYGRRRRRQGA